MAKVIKKINTDLTYGQLMALPYQTIQRVVKVMDIDKAVALQAELDVHIAHIYQAVSGYAGATPKKVIERDETGEICATQTIFKQPVVGPKDFQALMSGLKKLEVVYGYFYDRTTGSTYCEVR